MDAHPHFISPHRWHRRLDDALAQARAEERHLFILVGRLSCGGSRALVEKTVAKEEIAEYLGRHYVLVAADADAPEPAVAALVEQMAHRDRTPFCLYLASDGTLVHSTSGGRPPAVFLADLIEASRKLPPRVGG
jgi:hypothetical protein